MSKRCSLRTLAEHPALHEADGACCNILRACIRLAELDALNGLRLIDETRQIHALVAAIHNKLTAAHQKYDGEHPGLRH